MSAQPTRAFGCRTGGWRLGSYRGETTTDEMAERMKTRNELGFRIEREREGEEQNDWKAWEKVMGGCDLWILVLAGNERVDIKSRTDYFRGHQSPSRKPANIVMFISKFFVGILFVAAAYTTATGQFSRLLSFHGNTG